MGRFTDIDEDEARLPEGMQRVGYDADTERYTFRDADGSLWESAPGSRYGELRPVGHQSSHEDIEAMNSVIEEDQQSAMRTMLPFGVLIFVFLFGVFKLVDGH
ncbi:hypothetical protein IQ06DRAFT_298966 [Phaeosphaeriaceae sp. SRC1lsM3a]|nr:hypothetical protein IQ06DRAFT_298966 [Stagonospora sp. SRC1lsM3a]